MEPYREIEDFLRRRRSRYEGDRVFRVLVITVVLVAVCVTSAGYLQAPTYEASAQVWVDQEQGDQQMELAGQAGSGEMIKTLPPKGEGLQAIIQTLVYAIDSHPVAEEVIQRLGLQMDPAELLDNLTVEQIENTSFIVLTYEDTSPARAQRIVNTVGEVSSEFISQRSSDLTANVFERAAVPHTPVSPNPLRNGLVTLVVGLALSVLALAPPRPLAARAAGILSECVRVVRQGVGQARLPGRRHSDTNIVERVKEKKLLLALGRRGKLTAVEAALETSLSVEEAERILSELAFAGHLEVTVEDGKLRYSFWGEEHEG